jgi:phosphoglycolate phosphatase
MTAPRIALWDMDGTLVRTTAKVGANVYVDAVALAGGKELIGPVGLQHGNTDGQVIWSLLAENDLPEDLHEVATAHLERLSSERDTRPEAREATPGITEALHAVAGAGWVNGLLTGNSATRARYKMEGTGIDPDLFDWDRSYFGSHARIRNDITSRAAEELAGSTVVIIGDTPGDGTAADHVGFPFIAVATGRFSVEELLETNAVLVVPDMLAGLPDVLAKLAEL